MDTHTDNLKGTDRILERFQAFLHSPVMFLEKQKPKELGEGVLTQQ